jgi:diaminopimelate decarboxylase
MGYRFMDHKAYGRVLKYESIKCLEEKYSLPLYIYDENIAIANAREIKKCLGKEVRLCYSAKANYYLAEAVGEIADMIEVSTIKELQYCLKQRISADRLIYSGVWKSKEDFDYVLKAGVDRIVLDSVKQTSELQNIARGTVEVLLRLSSGNQFGMNVEEIEQIIKYAGIYDNLNIVGIQYYAGTQRKCLSQVQRDIKKFADQLQYLEEKGICFKEVQIGGGIGVPLFYSERKEEFEEAADCMFAFIEKLSINYKVTYECGRGIAANAGQYVTQVFDRKWRDDRDVLLIRGGNNHLSYYGNICGQRQPFIESVIREEKKGPEYKYMICGSLCSANDILSMEYIDYSIEEGDYIIFYNVGAYSLQEAATLFLAMEMPRILVHSKDYNGHRVLELEWMNNECTGI